jgi:hypothetical protein
LALPRLDAVSREVDRLGGMIGQLPADTRRAIPGVDALAMATLNQMFDRVLAIPGAADVLRPTIDTLKQRLTAISRLT